MSEADILIMFFFLALAIYAVLRNSTRKRRIQDKIDRERSTAWSEYLDAALICENLNAGNKTLTKEYDDASKRRRDCLRKWEELNKKTKH